jgi:coniferyl-aldehyde dehydrogenase
VVWVHESELETLLTHIQLFIKGLFPTTADNIDVTPIVNDRHLDRVASYVKDANAKGARIVVAGDDNAANRRLPLRMVVNPSADSEIAKC